MVNIVDNVLDTFKDILILARKKMNKYESISDENILDMLEQDYINGGLDWLYRKKKLVAVIRYEVINEGTVANIFDLIIDNKEKDSFKIMKYFAALGWVKFPSLRYIKFQRALKDNRGYRMYKIKNFFNGGNYGK